MSTIFVDPQKWIKCLERLVSGEKNRPDVGINVKNMTHEVRCTYKKNLQYPFIITSEVPDIFNDTLIFHERQGTVRQIYLYALVQFLIEQLICVLSLFIQLHNYLSMSVQKNSSLIHFFFNIIHTIATWRSHPLHDEEQVSLSTSSNCSLSQDSENLQFWKYEVFFSSNLWSYGMICNVISLIENI